jgi:hypothetical protein
MSFEYILILVHMSTNLLIILKISKYSKLSYVFETARALIISKSYGNFFFYSLVLKIIIFLLISFKN